MAIDAKVVARKLTPFVNTLIVAKAFALAERDRVNEIKRRILSEQIFTNRDARERVLNPEYDWIMVDADFERYLTILHGEYTRTHWKDLKYGYCPALIAEHLQTKAEWALIEASEPFFGVSNDKLLCGTKDKGGMETRQEFIDLLCKLCVNAPGYVAPKLGESVLKKEI